jgi:hypothetical protein
MTAFERSGKSMMLLGEFGGRFSDGASQPGRTWAAFLGELMETSLSEYLEATNGCLVHVVGKELVGFDILGRAHLARRETV